MSKVQKDNHGFYVRVNGGVYRPEKSVDDYEITNRTFTTRFKEGEQVNVKNINRTPFCEVSNSKFIEEIWGFHGCGMQLGKTVPSENCWNPI